MGSDNAKKGENNMSGNEYAGLETADEIIEAIESIASGRACDENSPAWNIWSSPKKSDYIEIETYLDTHYPGWRKEGLNWGWDGKWTGSQEDDVPERKI